MDLSNKVAVVTGSGQGLGLAYATELARHGAAVVINDVDRATADAAVATITAAGGRAVAVVAPVGPTETARKLVAAAARLDPAGDHAYLRYRPAPYPRPFDLARSPR